ncbi:MAG: type II secretion system protein [Betaproteobacteria bacterium]|nr:type II secretion system protein [Betaproteobacteria bacterium]
MPAFGLRHPDAMATVIDVPVRPVVPIDVLRAGAKLVPIGNLEVPITSERLRQRIRWIRPQHGFTLVELVVVMIVIAILAVAVVPRFSLLSGFDEVGYRDKVKATLEFARKAAVAQRRYVCVTKNGNGLVLTRDLRDPDPLTFASVTAATCPNAGSSQVTLPAPDTAACGGATAGNEICAPANSTSITLSAPATLLIFNPLGQPSSTANCSTTNFCYTVTGTDAYTITVEAETGYVH